MTMSPDYFVLGVSAISFIGGMKGALAFEKQVEDFTGLKISCGSLALAAGLRKYGENIRRIAFVSPYYPAANAHVSRFLTDAGFEVARDVCLRCTSWTDIAMQPRERLLKVLRDELDGDDIDAICQVGTNLSMVRLADEAERWLGKPVIAINTATYWHALRTNGLMDQMDGFGRLMAEF